MSSDQILCKEECYRIIGACFEVYNDKENGFLEAVYQECLAIELRDRQIPFIEKPAIQPQYKGRVLKQEYEPDFLCCGEIIIEIKAAKALADEHRAQIINYLKSSNKQLGLLINFGHRSKLEHERFINQSCLTTNHTNLTNES